jgi:hypothetical protein
MEAVLKDIIKNFKNVTEDQQTLPRVGVHALH